MQKPESSSSPKAVEEKVAESKTAMTRSLIDFSMEPEVSDTAAVQETHQIVPYVDAGNSTESSIMNTSKPQNVNSVESLLFELSALAIVPASTTSEAPNASDASPALPIVLSNEVGATITGSTTMPSVPSNEILALPSSTGEYNTAKANEGQQLVTMQHYQPSVLAAGDSGSNCQQSIFLYNQVRNIFCLFYRKVSDIYIYFFAWFKSPTFLFLGYLNLRALLRQFSLCPKLRVKHSF